MVLLTGSLELCFASTYHIFHSPVFGLLLYYYIIIIIIIIVIVIVIIIIIVVIYLHIFEQWQIYRVRINYRRISLRHNLSRKCHKIVKFVSIPHNECNIWNGPIVATAISREKRKPVLEWNGCLAFCTRPPWSPAQTVRDFFLRGCVKDNVYVPPLPKTQPELQESINTAIGNVTQDMLDRVWREWEYRLYICRVTLWAHIECI